VRQIAPYFYVGCGLLVLAIVAALLVWDLIQNIRHTPPKKKETEE
jgi:hypothetical protein